MTDFTTPFCPECGHVKHVAGCPEARAMSDLEAAAKAVLRAVDAYRDALNGRGHEGEPHDRLLWQRRPGDVQIYSPDSDCAACGGAQYGTEDDLNVAYGDLREALGEPRELWEGTA